MKFTTRELLLVTLIVSLLLGWWIDHRRSHDVIESLSKHEQNANTLAELLRNEFDQEVTFFDKGMSISGPTAETLCQRRSGILKPISN